MVTCSNQNKAQSHPLLSRSKECWCHTEAWVFPAVTMTTSFPHKGSGLPKHQALAQTFDFLQGNDIKANSLSLPNRRLVVRNFSLRSGQRPRSSPKPLGSTFPLLSPTSNKQRFKQNSCWFKRGRGKPLLLFFSTCSSLVLAAMRSFFGPCFVVTTEIGRQLFGWWLPTHPQGSGAGRLPPLVLFLLCGVVPVVCWNLGAFC